MSAGLAPVELCLTRVLMLVRSSEDPDSCAALAVLVVGESAEFVAMLVEPPALVDDVPQAATSATDARAAMAPPERRPRRVRGPVSVRRRPARGAMRCVSGFNMRFS